MKITDSSWARLLMATFGWVLVACPAVRAERPVVMNVESLVVPEGRTAELDRALSAVLERACPRGVLGPERLLPRARADAATDSLLRQAEDLFGQGRKLHVELEHEAALHRYRQAAQAYSRTGAWLLHSAALVEVHLQTAAVLAETARLAEAMEALGSAIALDPDRELDPGLYNPTLRKLHAKKRAQIRSLEDLPAGPAELQAIARLSGAALLLRPLVEGTAEQRVLRLVFVDLRRAQLRLVKRLGVSGAEAELPVDLEPLLRTQLCPAAQEEAGNGSGGGTDPVPAHRPLVTNGDEPQVIDAHPVDSWLAAGIGGGLGLGRYPEGSFRLELAWTYRLSRGLRLRLGSGVRLAFATREPVPASPTLQHPGASLEWEADLLFAGMPIEIGLAFAVPLGRLELVPRLDFSFDLFGAFASHATCRINDTCAIYSKDRLRTFGYGPGLRAGVDLHYELSPGWWLVLGLSYRMSKLFWADPLQVTLQNDLGGAGGTIDSPMLDLLHGLELSCGVLFGL